MYVFLSLLLHENQDTDHITAVKFNVNQIGNDDKAAAFLDKLQILASGATAKEDFHVTAGKYPKYFCRPQC